MHPSTSTIDIHMSGRWVLGAGVNARSMADVKLFNRLFSDCGAAYRPLAAQGLRVGYPRNFWEDLGWEVRADGHASCRVVPGNHLGGGT